MRSPRCSVLVLLTLFALAAWASAQVTFSRDWSGGKRSPPAVFDCGQLTTLCRHFLHDLKQTMSAKKLDKRQQLQSEELQLVYEDEK
ncbi:uncharacterized protein LOC116775217 [Danaus plexippus]|uniref:AKH/corazonin hormone n=1 Tax=Danaus plexippus plexippus TaxID=278856 RepID=A0A212F1J4_DANPL|nr:uncharacterized protein LOC116775217 [Danaus plexippus]OWR47583.1 AKH/corazonin hormone precursor [Danaus plexippus plexippus]